MREDVTQSVGRIDRERRHSLRLRELKGDG